MERIFPEGKNILKKEKPANIITPLFTAKIVKKITNTYKI